MKLSDALKRMLQIPELAEGLIRNGLVTVTLQPTHDFELPAGKHQIRYGDNTIPLIITIPPQPDVPESCQKCGKPTGNKALIICDACWGKT